MAKRNRWSEKWKHAFAVDPPGPLDPTPEQREVVDWFCREVVRRGLSTPSLIALEMSRPLNFVTSQFMHWTQPAVWAVAPAHITAKYDHFARFLEHRGSVEYIVRRIEEIEAEGPDAEGRRGDASEGGAEPAITGEADSDREAKSSPARTEGTRGNPALPQPPFPPIPPEVGDSSATFGPPGGNNDPDRRGDDEGNTHDGRSDEPPR